MNMRPNKTKPKTTKMIWRISEAAPLGEWVRPVDIEAHRHRGEPASEEDAREKSERGWHHSSRELVQGMEVHEESLDTLSDDVLDQLFNKKD